MKERPILFSGEMVRAILDGRKTMTRRVIKYPYIEIREDSILASYCHDPGTESPSGLCYKISCPHGQPGDLLWVREAWGGPILSTRGKGIVEQVLYRQGDKEWRDHKGHPARWHPSIFMPRWASRLTLEITAVRVERVQDISEKDAKAEGADGYVGGEGFVPERELAVEPGYRHLRFFRDGFPVLWDSLNAKRGYGWDTNPWVWVISFRRLP